MAETHPMLQVGPNSAEILAGPPTKSESTGVTVTSHVPAGMTPKPLPRVWRRTFILRTLLLIFAPILITVLYIVMWRYFMVSSDGDLKFGTPGHQWLFYAWFLIGVFALGWSEDGLVGVEVAMLQTPFWRARDDAALAMHMDNRWGGPAGWLYWIRNVQPKGRLHAHRLLALLSCLSILMFIGLPLSGLTLGLTEGFVASSTSPLVVGHTKENFYDRKPTRMLDLLANSWKIGSLPIVPGYGILYTPPNVSRSDYDSLLKFPNTLPLDKSVPEIFLAPQATDPIGGTPWGLRASYNCSIVEDPSAFTILNQRSSSILDVSKNASQREPPNTGFTIPWATLETPSGNSISSFISRIDTGPARNIWSYVEIGKSEVQPGDFKIGDTPPANKSDIYYNGYKGVVEYLLWQVRMNNTYGESDNRYGFKFNETLGPTIKGMPSPVLQLDNGTWIHNETFFQVKKRNGFDGPVRGTVDIAEYLGFTWDLGTTVPPVVDMSRIQSAPAPIGVRCEHIVAAGTAKLETTTSSFSSFTPDPPLWDVNVQERNSPFGSSVAEVMTARYFDLFTSTGSPAPVLISNSPAFHSYVQPQILLKSILLLFGLDALHIMYDGGGNGFEGAWLHENLTSSTKGWIITPGDVPPFIPLIFFVPWTVACLVLAARYGFVPRLSDKLDDDSLAQLKEELDERRDIAGDS